MGSPANVRSIAALDEMNNALKRFQGEATSALNAADMEIKRTIEWLQDRLKYWQNELRHRQQALIEAQRALQACMRSGNREHPPDCSAYQVEVARRQRLVQEAKRELQIVMMHIKRVEEAVQHYQSAARQLATALNGELLQASSFLSSRANILYSYASNSVGTPSSASMGSDGAAAFPSSQVLPLVGAGGNAGSAFPSSPALPLAGRVLGGYIGNTQYQMVAIADIDLSDQRVKGAADFIKGITPDQMKDGFQKLQNVVLPAVAQGADRDYFARLDAAQGLGNANGYLQIYYAFFSDPDAIRLSNVNGKLTVDNGFHCLFIAQQLGITHVPARVFFLGQP